MSNQFPTLHIVDHPLVQHKVTFCMRMWTGRPAMR